MQDQTPGAWAAAAAPGTSVVYFVGCLPDGREHDRAINFAAEEYMRLAERGLVRLTRRRVGPADSKRFAYTATRTSRPTEAAAILPASPEKRLRNALAVGELIVAEMLAVC